MVVEDTFGADTFSNMFVVERAHRVPTRPLPLGAPPRPFLLKLLHSRDRDTILQLARQNIEMVFLGARIFIFPDFSAENQLQRTRYADVKGRLHALNIPYSSIYPAQL